MARCVTCGVRLAADESRCAAHAASAAGPGEAALVPERDPRWQTLPVLRGYRIVRAVGHGGMGAVYLAKRELDGGLAAVKVAARGHALAAASLRREAALLREIGAPHAPTVHAEGELPDGTPYVVIDYLATTSLADLLARRRGPLLPEEIAPVALAVVDAVAAVHARRIVHLDLKPENVFVWPERRPPQATVIDFGVAQHLDGRSSLSGVPADAELLVGTAEYMSPEQCASSDVDRRADVYALGVMLYEMHTGRPPFFGTEADVRSAHRDRRPVRPSELCALSSGVERAILRCLDKDRNTRFVDAGELREALRGAFSEKAASERPAPPLAAPAAAPARERRSVAAVFAQTQSGVAVLQQALSSFGGQLAHAAVGALVGVFAHDVADNPVRRALFAAQALLARGLVANALVDVVTVSVTTRPDGGHRFLSPLFTRRERYAPEGTPAAVLVTAEAAALLHDVPLLAVEGYPALAQLSVAESTQVEQPTSVTSITSSMGPLVGRETLLASLLDSARRAHADGVPTLVTVTAEPGHGKSHVAAAAFERLRDALPDARRLDLRAREPVGGDADQTLRELLWRALQLPAARPDDGGRASVVERLGREQGEEVWPAVALVLGWLEPESPELARFAAAPGVLRAAAARAAGGALRQIGREHALVLLLDDAQWADEVTLNALEYATQPEPGLRLWVCVLARPAFAATRPRWGDQAARREVLPLGPLTLQHAAELCRRLLQPAVDVPALAIERLVARTEGSPLLLVELVRGLKQKGLVRRHSKGQSSYLATDELELFPDLPLVEWLAARELEALPPELAAHARLAAALGADFGREEIAGVLSELDRRRQATDFPLDATVGTRRLLTAGLLITHRRGRLSFRSALVRDAVYGSTPDALRRPIHAAAFHYYRDRALRALTEDERLPRIAFHAAHAGLEEEAALRYVDLGERAQHRHAYLEAELMYTQALAVLPREDAKRRMLATQGRALMRYRVGRNDDALSDYARARELAQHLGDVAAEVEVLLDEATALDYMNEFRKSQALVERAKTLSSRMRTPHVEARLLMGIGRTHQRLGDWLEASVFLDSAARRATDIGSAAYETLVASLLLLETVLPALERVDDADQVCQRILALCQEHGDLVHLSFALNNRRLLLIAKKDVEGAVRDQRRAAELGRETGVVTQEFYSEYNVGELYFQAGNLEAAWPAVRRAVDLEQRLFGEASRQVASLLEARLLAYEGREADARALFEALSERQKIAAAEQRADTALLPNEDVLLGMVDLATRDAGDDEWSALGARSDAHSVEQEPIEVVEARGLCALRHGRIERGVRQLDAALALAARIPNILEARIVAARGAALSGRPGLENP